MPQIDIGGVRFHYIDEGYGDVIFLLHGNAGSGKVWRKVIPRLSSKYRVIAHDRQGFGQSKLTKNGDFSPFGFSEELKRLMDALEIERAHICGVSFGGMVAQVFAIENIDRINKLILVGTMADRTDRDVEETLKTLRQDGWPTVAKRLANSWFYPGSDPADVEESFQICLQSTHQMRENTVKALGTFNIKNKINQIVSPTLIMVGADYTSTPIEFSEFLRDNIDGARLEVIQNCGHLVSMDQPEIFCDLAIKFLEYESQVAERN